MLPDLVSLLDSVGLDGNATAAKVLPFISHLGTVAIGSGSADGSDHLRLVISGT